MSQCLRCEESASVPIPLGQERKRHYEMCVHSCSINKTNLAPLCSIDFYRSSEL